MRLLVVLLLSTALASAARAGGADDEERARGHYEIGLGLYRLGDYEGALKEFGAGYELARKPGFLLNLGQTYRKLGELREARDMYRQYLAAVPHDDPALPEARKVLAELERAIRTARPPESPQPPPSPPATEPAPAPAPTPPSAAPPMPPPAAAAPAPAVAPVAVHASAPPHRSRRALRIAGIAVGVAGLGLVGGGIGTAVAADGLARDLNTADRAGGVFDPAQDHAYSVDRALATGFFVSGAALAATGAILLIVSAR